MCQIIVTLCQYIVLKFVDINYKYVHKFLLFSKNRDQIDQQQNAFDDQNELVNKHLGMYVSAIRYIEIIIIALQQQQRLFTKKKLKSNKKSKLSFIYQQTKYKNHNN